MSLSIVIASAKNGCIGRDNTLPWSLPKDMKRFKEITTKGHTILIMGRKTYESIGRPLPGRLNFVISSDKNYHPHSEVYVFNSLEKAIDASENVEYLQEENYNTFLIGGAGLFKEAIEKGFVDNIYHTLIDADIEGDTFIELPDWKISDEVEIPIDDKHQYAMTFRTLSKN